MLIVTEARKDFKPVPAGTHLAICTTIVDMGVQADSKFGPRRKIFFKWELPEQQTTWRDKQGKERSGPMQISKSYTFSLNSKASLRADLESWRGKLFTEAELKKGFDVSDFLGKICMVGVVHNESGDRTYANVRTIMGAPSSVKLQSSGPLLVYDADDPDPEIFALLPSWLQQKINERVVVEKVAVQTSPIVEEFNDNIPI